MPKRSVTTMVLNIMHYLTPISLLFLEMPLKCKILIMNTVTDANIHSSN